MAIQKESLNPEEYSPHRTVESPREELKDLVKDIHQDSTPKPSNILATATAPEPALLNKSVPVSNASNESNSHTTSSNFQYQVLENIVHDSLEAFAQEIKQDIQNMHIELLKQFQTQKVNLSYS